jgi:putative sterol carrier protein
MMGYRAEDAGTTLMPVREATMATVDECRTALKALAAKLDANAAAQGKLDLERPIACTIRDLDVSFHGRLSGGRLVDLTDGDDPGAKIRLTSTGDDLVALVAGELDFAKAWATGRLSVRGNPLDLLKLRKLL